MHKQQAKTTLKVKGKNENKNKTNKKEYRMCNNVALIAQKEASPCRH